MATKLDLINTKPSVVSMGVESFANDMSSFTEVEHLRWTPPAWGNEKLARISACMLDDSVQGTIGWKISEANKKAFSILTGNQPVLVDIRPAIEVLEDMDENTFLHAGPPIEWKNMCGSMRGGMIGGMLYEGKAETAEEAEQLLASGKIRFAPCHSRNAAGPMAGIVTPSMPMFIIENKQTGKKGYCTMNEGWGRSLRFGAFDENVITRLHWMEKTLSKGIKVVIEACGGVDTKVLISQAVQAGDECHNRDISATNLFFKLAAPKIVESKMLTDREKIEIINFLGQHEHFFLNLAMATCKAGLVSAENIPYSTMATVMARNGYEVGIRVSCMGNEWFTAPAEIPDGLYFPGFSPADANPDIGDSAVTETGGLGAFAMGAAPAIVQFVGGTSEQAFQYTKDMYRITIGKNNNFKIPNMSFQGTPTGIDIAKVLNNNMTPIINTGIAHKEPGHGLVGAGVVRAPRGCFEKAVLAFYEKYRDEFVQLDIG